MCKSEKIRQKLVSLKEDYNKKRKELEKEYQTIREEEINNRLKNLKEKYLGKVVVLLEKGFYKEYIKVRDINIVRDVEGCDFELKGSFIRKYFETGEICLSIEGGFDYVPIAAEKENLLTEATINELDELYQLVYQTYEKMFI